MDNGTIELQPIDILALSDDGVVISNAGNSGKPEDATNGNPEDEVRLPNGKPIPRQIAILTIGKNSFTKDGKDGSFDISDDDADKIIENHQKKQRDLALDYEHSALDGSNKTHNAGWCDLVKKAGKIVAILKMLTPEAKEDFKTGAYRYFSPVVRFDGGKVKEIQGLSLTSHPALHKAPDLLSCSDATAKSELFNKHLEASQNIMLAFNEVSQELFAAMNKTAELAQGNPDMEAKVVALKDKLENGGLSAFADQPATTAPSVTAAQPLVATASAAQMAPALDAATQPSVTATTPSAGTTDAIGTMPAINPKPVGSATASPTQSLHDNLQKVALEAKTPEEYKGKVSDMLELAKTPEEKSMLKNALAFMPEKFNQQGTGMGVSTLAASDVELKSIASLLKLSDTAGVSEITQRVSHLTAFAGVAGAYFKQHGAKSFSDLDKKHNEQLALKDTAIKTLTEQLALADSESVISKYMREGKVTEATKGIEMQALKAMGKEAYGKYMECRQPVIALSDAKTIEALGTPKVGSQNPSPAGFDTAAVALDFTGEYDGVPAAMEMTLPW